LLEKTGRHKNINSSTPFEQMSLFCQLLESS
jgi:hypothetical protein